MAGVIRRLVAWATRVRRPVGEGVTGVAAMLDGSRPCVITDVQGTTAYVRFYDGGGGVFPISRLVGGLDGGGPGEAGP